MFQKKDIYIFIIADILKDWNELAWLTSYQRKHRGKVDPDELKPKLLFFTLKEPISHYGDGI